MNKVTTYLKEVWAELYKVNWPSQREATYLTILVILLSFAVAAYLGVFDKIFTWLVSQIIM